MKIRYEEKRLDARRLICEARALILMHKRSKIEVGCGFEECRNFDIRKFVGIAVEAQKLLILVKPEEGRLFAVCIQGVLKIANKPFYARKLLSVAKIARLEHKNAYRLHISKRRLKRVLKIAKVRVGQRHFVDANIRLYTLNAHP